MNGFDLPSKLGTVKNLIERFERAKSRKGQWETHLRDCYQFALPQRETFNAHAPGAKKNVDIFDSTAVVGVQKFASRLQATLVPPWRHFSILAPGSEVPENEREKVQSTLDKITDIVFDYINHSNFDTQCHEAFLDLSVSTGALTIEEGDGDNLLHFNAVPLAEIYPEEGPNGTIETNWRKHKAPGRHVERLWPGIKLSVDGQKRVKEKPEDTIDLIEGVVYEPDSSMYYNVVIEEDGEHLAFMQSYETSPWVIFREMVIPGEILGRGRVMSVLPDIKTTNKVVEFVLKNAALAISGVYTGVSDGVLNPYTMQIAPGSVIPVMSNDRGNPSLAELPRSGDFSVAELVLDDLRSRINKALFAEPFGEIDQPVRSATEMALRGQELVQDAGAAFSRLQTEFVEKVIKRVVDILQRAGKIPELRVDGKEVTIKHTSPLARAQDQEDLLSLNQYIQTVAPLGPEVMMLGTKIEDLPGYVGKRLGIPQDLIRSEGERGDMQEKVAQILAAMQAGAQDVQQPA